VLLSAIALTRLPAGIEFLLQLVESEDRQAERAIEALAAIAATGDVRDRVEQAIEGTGSQRLSKAWLEQMASKAAQP
jgi:hypothetical protein